MKNIPVMILFGALLVASVPVYAQLLPTEENNATAIEVREASEAERQSIISQTSAFMVSEPQVKSSLERTFDVSRDKKLQELELKRYLFTVVNFVRNKKKLDYNTPIIKYFDKNQDGIIDLEEARYIEIALG